MSSTDMTLPEYQKLIRQLAEQRGFMDESLTQVFTLLVEEIGELAKAIRKTNGQKIGSHSKDHTVPEEAADVFWLLIDLCNRLNIDLAQAFNDKEEINKQRTWSSAA